MSTLLVEMQKMVEDVGEEEKTINGAVHEVTMVLRSHIQQLQKEGPLNQNQANKIQVKKALRPECVEFAKKSGHDYRNSKVRKHNGDESMEENDDDFQ